MMKYHPEIREYIYRCSVGGREQEIHIRAISDSHAESLLLDMVRFPADWEYVGFKLYPITV